HVHDLELLLAASEGNGRPGSVRFASDRADEYVAHLLHRSGCLGACAVQTVDDGVSREGDGLQMILALGPALGFGGRFSTTFWHILYQVLRRLALTHALTHALCRLPFGDRGREVGHTVAVWWTNFVPLPARFRPPNPYRFRSRRQRRGRTERSPHPPPSPPPPSPPPAAAPLRP